MPDPLLIARKLTDLGQPNPPSTDTPSDLGPWWGWVLAVLVLDRAGVLDPEWREQALKAIEAGEADSDA